MFIITTVQSVAVQCSEISIYILLDLALLTVWLEIKKQQTTKRLWLEINKNSEAMPLSQFRFTIGFMRCSSEALGENYLQNRLLIEIFLINL